MSGDWMTVSVADCVDASFRPTGRPIPKSSFKATGKYPVVDQGSDKIAGWTDDEEALVTTGLPLIVFGDHTRSLKFLERPFVRGADGTQVLLAADGIDPQFLFYACRALDLPSRGYNRHFALLRESAIRRPADLLEQQQIGLVLRAIDDVVAHQWLIKSTWMALKAAVMKQVFVAPDQLAEVNADGWRADAVGAHFSVRSGTTPARGNSSFWEGGSIPWVKTGEIGYRTIESTEEHITETAVASGAATIFPAGSVLVAMYGQGVTRGRAARLGIDAACNQACAVLNPTDDAVLPAVLYYYLEWQYKELRALAHGGNQQNLNLDIIRAFPMAYPRRQEQAEIAHLLELLDHRIELARRRLHLTQDVFDHLLYGMTSGEVALGDIDMVALTSIQASLERMAA